MGPLVNAGIVGPGLNLVFAFAIGLAFGAILEQAGFSSGRKITAVFYGRDFAVPKVMFTAMVTAGVGVVVADSLGLMDASVLAIPGTYLWPQIVGGLIFGVGMVVSGYCPGTGLVSAGIGRIDAMVALAGILVGTLVGSLAMPSFWDFYMSGAKGAYSLVQVFNAPVGFALVLVVGFALFFFWMADRIQALVTKQPAPAVLGPWNPTTARWLAGATLSVCAIAGLGAYPLIPGEPVPEPVGMDLVKNVAANDHALPAERLEALINGGDEPYFLVDLRATEEYAKGSLPGAYSIPAALVTIDGGLDRFPRDRKVILYDEDGSRASQLLPVLRANGVDAYVVGGGLLGWASLKSGSGAGLTLEAPKTAAPPPPPMNKKKSVGFQDKGC